MLASSLLSELGAEVWDIGSSPLEDLGKSNVDIVLVDRAGLDYLQLNGVDPHELSGTPRGPIIVVVSSFGLTGPLSECTGSELVIQALTSISAANGYPEDPPVQIGVPVAQCGAAIYAVIGALAGLIYREKSRQGQVLDIAEYDVAFSFLATILPTYFLSGEPFPRIGNRHAMTAPWNAYATADGWVVISTMGDSLWKSLLEVIGRLDLLDDPSFADADQRVLHVESVDEAVTSWTSELTTTDVNSRLVLAGIPVAPVHTLAEALSDDQTKARDLIRVVDGETRFGSIFKLSDLEMTGAHDSRTSNVIPVSSGPLAGVRCVEIGSYTAGPLVGRILGQLGAEVVKVEPPKGEGSRHLAQRILDTGYLFFTNNTDKFGVELALETPEGVAAIKKLLSTSDMFLTNLAAETVAKLGLSVDQVSKTCPSLIYASITGYGLTGPKASLKAFDTVVQAGSGIMSLTGFPSRPPLKSALSISDIFAACAGAAGSLAALLRRNRTGCGQLVDISMFDCAVWLTHSVWPTSLGDSMPTRMGNKNSKFCPHDLYRAGDGVWVAIAVTDEEQWVRFCGMSDSISKSIREASGQERVERREEIDSIVSAWIAQRSGAEAVECLATIGMPAGKVNLIGDAVAHPQTVARELLIDQEDEVYGRLHVIGSPFKFSVTPARVQRRAPRLGEHNSNYFPDGVSSFM